MVKVTFDISAMTSQARLRLVREQVGKALYRQSFDRILKGGDDEVTFVPLRFHRPDGSSDHVLNHTGQHLLAHMDYDYDANSVSVFTQAPGARVMQLGTVGKSAPGVGQGILPTIKPVYAKALFIPISVKAASMTSRDRNGGADVVKLRQEIKDLRGKKGKQAANMLARRVDKLEKVKEAQKGSGLVKGVDFIFAQKVDLPPRPFLRMGKSDVKELGEVFAGHRPRTGA